MVAYANTAGCLRAAILRYFGDPAVRDPCGACGSCRPLAIDAYDRDLVRRILAGISRAGERYGRRRIVAMLVGDTRELPPSLAALSTTGSLRDETPEAVGRWVEAAIAAGLILVSADQYRTLGLTARGREVMSGRDRGAADHPTLEAARALVRPRLSRWWRIPPLEAILLVEGKSEM
jgi:ATP-dependent DNA helicase RecQ